MSLKKHYGIPVGDHLLLLYIYIYIYIYIYLFIFYYYIKVFRQHISTPIESFSGPSRIDPRLNELKNALWDPRCGLFIIYYILLYFIIILDFFGQHISTPQRGSHNAFLSSFYLGSNS